VEALYPASLGRLSTDEFMKAAVALDEAYAARVQAARAEGQVLRYVARVEPDGGEVSLLPVPQDSPLGALRGPANYVVFHTNRYSEAGLVVSGPGAGPEVTAAGVLEDILEAINLDPQIPARIVGETTKPTLTMKFGGTSIGRAEGITRAADLVMEQARAWDRLVIVVSAMSGVTDALIEGARTAASGNDRVCLSSVEDLRERHHRVIDELLGSSAGENGQRAELLSSVDEYLDDLAAFCHSLYVLGEVTPRSMDAVTSLGERISARVLAAVLRQRGARSEAVDASDLIITDSNFQSAVPLMDPTRARVATRLVPLLDEGIIPVVTGFVGATVDGVPTTLGRGGSDYSAAILGDCLDAHQVWIWSDVDGVMTADPRIVPDARVLPTLSYNEVAELAYFGAKVVHPRTIRPVVERGIPLWVKNTFNPACPGTRITDKAEATPGTVKAVTAIEGLSMVTVEGRGMMGVPGIAARTFAAVASQKTSVLMISQASSEQSICFLIPTETVRPVIHAIEEEMSLELARRDIDRVWSLDNVVIVTAVGAGLRTTPGVAARLFGALAQAAINVIAVAQGSSECSISLAVAAEDATSAVRQIHSEVILKAE
jgi:aspartokinase/homoserine dehydrogenase 1